MHAVNSRLKVFSHTVLPTEFRLPMKGMFNVLNASMQFSTMYTHTMSMYVFRADEMEVRNEYIGEQNLS